MSTHKHSHEGPCNHGTHEHEHAAKPNYIGRLLLSVSMVLCALFLLRSFIVEQIYERATGYATYRHHSDVVRLMKKVIALEPRHIPAWTALGYAYKDQRKDIDAIYAFSKVIELNPNDEGAASFELGKMYYESKDYAKALTYFERIESTGDQPGKKLDADIIKNRHGPVAMRSMRNLESLISMMLICYEQTGDVSMASAIRVEYEALKVKNKGRIF